MYSGFVAELDYFECPIFKPCKLIDLAVFINNFSARFPTGLTVVTTEYSVIKKSSVSFPTFFD